MENTNEEKNEMTIAELAAMIQRTMASKEDIQDLGSQIAALRSDIVEIKSGVALLPTRAELYEEVKKLNFAVELNDLQQRMKRVEEKVGLHK